MPTGYTAKLMEEGQAFPEFAMTCARAFGACIEMRDDSLIVPIPEKFAPSDYHEKALSEAKRSLDCLLKLNDDEKIQLGEARKAKSIADNIKWLAKDTEENNRLSEMSEQVKAWEPPTADHKGLKDFMLEQISISKQNTDYIQELIDSASAQNPMEFYNNTVDSAKRSVTYHTEQCGKEVERANGRTEWIQQLRNSLNKPMIK